MKPEINKKYLHLLEEAIASSAEEIKKFVEVESDEDLNRVSESVFVEYILPYLLGKVEHNEENNRRFFINFYNIAGDPKRPFIVVDDKTNEKLFTVPPLLGDYDNVNTPLEEISYATIVNNYNLTVENNRVLAEKELEPVLEAISKIVKVNPRDIKNVIEFYNMIKERYGSLLEESKEVEQQDKDDDYDLLEYEE